MSSFHLFSFSLKNTILIALRGEDLPDYPKDIQRLSRNIELSKVLNISQVDGIIRYLNETFDSALFDKTIGQLLRVNKTIGGGVEMNTIHSTETYWLRAAMLKTTLNLLGKEWEMVEVCVTLLFGCGLLGIRNLTKFGEKITLINFEF